MVTQSDAVEFGRDVASEFNRKNVPFMAAALAYYSFISLAPMLLLLFLLVTTVGVNLEAPLVQSAVGTLPGPIGDLVSDSLRAGSGATGASIVGMLVLGWGTLRLMLGLDTAFSEIYGTVHAQSILGQVRDGVVVFTALTVALIAVLGASVVLSGVLGRVPYNGWMTPVILLAGLVVAFYPIYYVFPDAELSVGDVLPGVLVAAVGWGTLQGLFQFYLSVAEPGTGYFFSGVIVVVTYLYFSAVLLLLGAVINAALDRRHVGDPASVSRPADSFTTERRTELDRAELRSYLTELRTELFESRDEESQSESVGGRPRPTGDIELLERSQTDGGSNEWLVSLRWEFSDDELVASMAARTGQEGDGATERPAASDGSGD